MRCSALVGTVSQVRFPVRLPTPTLQQEVTIMEKIITITLGVALIVSNALPGPIELTLILYAAFAMAVGYGLRNIPRLYKELKAV